MLPAAQGLEAENLAVDPGLGLVVQQELVTFESRTQIVLQAVPDAQLPIHLGIEKGQRLSSNRLCPVEGGVGIGH